MKKDTFYSSFDNIDEKYTSEAAEYAASRASAVSAPRRRSPLFKWAAAAACLILAVSAGIAGFAVAAEAREYAAAVEFFEENGLSTEGLSRAEIKEVYRDITTRSFTNGKTAEVIKKTVPGSEIALTDPTPRELAAEWDINSYRVFYKYHDPSYKTNSAAGIRYESEYVPDPDETTGKYILRCYRVDELLWTTELGDRYYPVSQMYTEFGTVVAGEGYYYSTSDTFGHAVLLLVDDNGAILWEKRINHGYGFERIGAVVDNRDGTFAVFSKGIGSDMCLSIYDPQGNELSLYKKAVGNYGVWNAALFGDGYLVQLGNSSSGETAYICKMDREGNINKSFSYESEDCVYTLTDMIEFDGRAYLSAYAVPKQEGYYGGRGEVDDILDNIFSRMEDNGFVGITGGELTDMLRENYTALLLVCDPEGGEPETFVSVKGALGSALSINGSGELVWAVESFESSFFSPTTSSFTIGATCRVFDYTFGADGSFAGVEDTGEDTLFTR